MSGWSCAHTAYLATHKCCRVRYIIIRMSGSAQWCRLFSQQSSKQSCLYKLETRGRTIKTDRQDRWLLMWKNNIHWKSSVNNSHNIFRKAIAIFQMYMLTWARNKLTVKKWGSLLNFLLKNITAVVHTYKRKKIVYKIQLSLFIISSK